MVLNISIQFWGIIYKIMGLFTKDLLSIPPNKMGLQNEKKKHLLEVAHALMFTKNMPKMFWGNAILTVTFLINRMPTRVLSFETTLQRLQKTFPFYRVGSNMPLKVFGCTTFVHIHPHNQSKLDPKARKCVFIGYSPTQKGYKCFDPSTKKVLVSHDVTLFENTLYFKKPKLQGENTSEAHFLDFNVLIPETIPASEPTSDTELVITDLEPTAQAIMPSSQPSPEPITPSHSTCHL